MKILVTGGAGCIGSELCERLVKEGNQVTIYDNFSSGKEMHTENLKRNAKIIKSDILDFQKLSEEMKGIELVFHLAANPDIKYSEGDQTDEDLKQNTIGTYNVLEAMRLNGVRKIAFASSSAVYGEPKTFPTPEDTTLEPISLYGASKAACEMLIRAFVHMFGFQAWIFRFANVVGGKHRARGTTVITDFINKLEKSSKRLEILGDGNQRKAYMLAGECIDGMLFATNKSSDQINLFNLGPEDNVSVDEIAKIVAEEMKLQNVSFSYTGGKRGWPGDVPEMHLDVGKMRRLGWNVRHTSKEAVRISVQETLKARIQ